MRAPQERDTSLPHFIVPRHGKFRYEVDGVVFHHLEDAERHAVYEGVRNPDQPIPKIFCRPRQAKATYFRKNTP